MSDKTQWGINPETIAGQLLAIEFTQSTILALLMMAAENDPEGRMKALHASLVRQIQQAISEMGNADLSGASAVNVTDRIFGMALTMLRASKN